MHTISFSLEVEETLHVHKQSLVLYPVYTTTWKKLTLLCSIRFLLLGNTRLYLALDDGLGFAHLLPVRDRLYAIGLEELY